MISKWCMIGAILIWAGGLEAASRPDAEMRQAAQIYQQGEYERAAVLFEGLVKAGHSSASIYYNLGTCYYQMDELGKAILNYERAALLQPGNPNIKQNLRLARNKVAGEPIAWPVFSTWVLWGSFRGMLSPNVWAVIGLAACWAALGCWLLARRAARPLSWQLISGFMVFAALLSWASAWSGARALSSEFSIAMPKEVEVLVGPDPQSGVLSTVYEGWKLRRLDRIGEWVKVELPDGQEGWLKRETIEDL